MIKRILHIKNFGVFQSYRRTGDIQDFNELNIIYGWNYTGKTTISRMFRCFENAELHQDYPSAEFEIVDTDDNRYSNTVLALTNTKMRVFNTDFIFKNLKWDGGSFEPILLLGEEIVEAEKKIKAKEQFIAKINKIIVDIKNTYQGLGNNIEVSLTDRASFIKTKLNLVNAFTKAHIRPILADIRNEYSNYILSATEENKLLQDANAKLEDKLSIIPEEKLDVVLSDLFNSTKNLVGVIPEFSKTIEYFISNPNVANWVELGIPLHSGKTKCEYCGNSIPEERNNELLAHFSEDLKNHQNSLSALIEKVNSLKVRITQHTERDFYPSIRSDFTNAKTLLDNSIKEYNKQIDNLLTILKRKKEKPFEKIIELDNVNDNSDSLKNNLVAYNGIISRNNKKTEDFDEQKETAITKLKKHYTSKFIDDFQLSKNEEKITLYEKREIRLLELKNEIMQEIERLEAKINKAQKGRESLNELIHSFLGRDEISIEVIKEGEKERFTLKRSNNKAINLSEGEKTAIAFSFFLTKLKEIEDTKSTIVYIDDPISSLDNNHIFQVNAIIKDFFFTNNNPTNSWELKYKQLFVSTHNFEFFSLLRELPLAKKNETVEYFYIRRINKNEATIERLPKSLKNYSSEYHFLFSVIYKYYQSDKKDDLEELYHIPNAVRRFVELYTYLRIPTNRSKSVDDRADILFGTEKSKRILKVMHYFSHSNSVERVVKNSDLICDIENAVNDLIEELKKDALHFEELLKSA